MILRPGDKFDRYVIEELLGEGGMGRVYRARDARLERRVALKVLRARALGEIDDDGAASGPPPKDAAARLLREARAVAQLDHPNAVSVFDVGEVDGTPYIAMELIDGRSLRAYMTDASVPLSRRVRWLIDIASALAVAHERGIVHRDIKPENVMVRADGMIKVLDFGIARRTDPGLASLHGDTLSTGSGVLVGTPQYMAPEQLRGEPVDGRADQFAWGVIAYELVSGGLPWRTKTGVQLVTEILSRDPPPLREKNADVPASVDATIRKTLAKAPRDRFSAMEDVVAALEPHASYSVRDVSIDSTQRPPPMVEDGHTPPAVEPPVVPVAAPARRSRGRTLGAAALVATLSIAGAFGLHALRSGARDASAPTASAASAAPGAPTAVTDLPIPKADGAEASAAYRAGLQSLRDASLMSALVAFQRAAAADGTLAPAHVRIAWMLQQQGDVAGARAAFQRARELRSLLDERDRSVVDAIEPLVVTETADFAEATRRADAAVARWPGDAELAFVAGRFHQRAGDRAGAMALYDRALADDPRFAAVWWARAIDAEDRGAVDEAIADYDQCVAVSPVAASCLRSRSEHFAQRGMCDRLEQDARRMVSIEPDGQRAYEFLARALAARGASSDAVRAALEQRWALLPEQDRAAKRRFDSAELALLAGDFATAIAEAQALAKLVATAKSERAHAQAAWQLVQAYEESGDVARAGAVADEFRRQRAAWVTSAVGLDGLDGIVPSILAASRRAHLLSDADYAKERDAWIAREGESLPAMWRNELWTPAFAAPAETPGEARAALAALAAYEPLPAARDLTIPDAAIGKAYFLVDDFDHALPALERAAATCLALDEPVEHTRATFRLGRAREAKGDAAGACAAYGAVLARWGAAKPRSITANAARARSRALGCANARH